MKPVGIPLPRWLQGTRTMQMNSIDVVLVMALVLANVGTAEAVRQAARNIRDKVCMEHRPKMRALAKLADDAAVMRCAINIVERATDAMGIHPGEPFPIYKAPEPVEWPDEARIEQIGREGNDGLIYEALPSRYPAPEAADYLRAATAAKEG